MKHIIDSVGSALVILTAALVASAPQAQEQAARPAVARSYEVVDLGKYGPPGLENYATHINAAGLVVGVVRTRQENADGIPVIFQRDQAPVPLNDRIGTTSGLNALGEVTGNVETASGGYEPFFWKDGVTTIVPSPAGTQSWLAGINDSSVAVGSRYKPGSLNTAIMYKDGMVTELGNWGGVGATAAAINNAGTIGGYRYVPRPRQGYSLVEAVRVGADGSVRRLNVFRSPYATTHAINAHGDVTGQYIAPPQQVYVGYAHIGGKAYSLALPGATQGWGWSINDHRSVVGVSDTADGPMLHAVLWERGELIDLNSLPEVAAAGWTLLYWATSINNDGVIVGAGIRVTGESHAYMLVPK